MLSALTYGSVAALLSEMFPPKIRYSSMSIPYHIGAGYLGGFLPLIAGVIVASTGDIYAGLWYTWVVVAIGVVVAWWGLPGGPPRDFESPAMRLPSAPRRRDRCSSATLRLDIDTDALADNWRTLDRDVGQCARRSCSQGELLWPGRRFAAFRRCAKQGCRDFFVAHWSEVAAPRGMSPPARSPSCMACSNAVDAAYARASGAVPVINSHPPG